MSNDFDDYEDYEEEYEYAVRPNKSQIKRDIAVLADLAEELAALSSAQLEQIPLSELLVKSVTEAAGMPHKGARKRQMKFITGLLRKTDVEPIKEKIADFKTQSAHAVREHHRIENWRDRLIAEGNEALTELINECPEIDRQRIMQLIRNAQKEAAAAKPPKSARELYRYLKEEFED